MIDCALSYYDIKESWYYENCYACMNDICESVTLKRTFQELLDILYVDKTKKINHLWSMKTTEDLFHEPVHPYVTCIALLCGYQLHQRNMEEHHFDALQQSIHKAIIK